MQIETCLRQARGDELLHEEGLHVEAAQGHVGHGGDLVFRHLGEDVLVGGIGVTGAQ